MISPRLLLAPVVVAALLWTAAPALAEPADPSAPGTPTVAADVQLGQGPIPAGKTGEPVQVDVPLINRGDGPAVDVLIAPKPAVDAASFPFEITQTDYTVAAGQLKPGETVTASLGQFTLRGGLASGYYALPLSIQYGDGLTRQVIEKTIFINVEGVPAPDPQTPDPITTVPPQTVEVVITQPPPADLGGYQPGGDPGYQPPLTDAGAGAGSPAGAGNASTPRVMLTHFATNPAEVLAGQSFKLGFGLQNMSNRVGVGNIKVTVVSSDASFLPANGASSVFINSIGAGQTAASELEFRALPTLEERPYQLTLNIEYEDNSNYQALTATESIAVVVRQHARAETGTLQAMPSSIMVGQESNVTFQVQNKGKVRLYNTRVVVKANQPISGSEVFIGNIEPGTSGSVDMMVKAEKPTTAPVSLEISFEDAAGVATTIERQVNIEIIAADETQGEEMPSEPMPSGPAFSVLPLAIFGLAAIAAVAAGYVIVTKRKQRREAELASSLESLDAEPIVPVDPN